MSYHGLPCWYELATSDLDGALAFYGAVLGWSVAEGGTPAMPYQIASASGAGVAGMMVARPTQPLAWTIYFAVDGCDASVAAAKALGASVIVPPTDIPDTGRFAVLLDPQGAAFSLLQPQPMAGGPTHPAFDPSRPGHGAWNELITTDPEAALGFYGKLLGWTQSRAMPAGPDITYHVFARDGVEMGGVLAPKGAAPHWRPYFGVPSTHAIRAAVTAAGGKVLHGPDPVPGGAFMVEIEDPQGVGLAVLGPA